MLLLLMLLLVAEEGGAAVVMTAFLKAATRASWSFSASWASFVDEGGAGVVMILGLPLGCWGLELRRRASLGRAGGSRDSPGRPQTGPVRDKGRLSVVCV